jgi:hypothetical protein
MYWGLCQQHQLKLELSALLQAGQTWLQLQALWVRVWCEWLFAGRWPAVAGY